MHHIYFVRLSIRISIKEMATIIQSQLNKYVNKMHRWSLNILVKDYNLQSKDKHIFMVDLIQKSLKH